METRYLRLVSKSIPRHSLCGVPPHLPAAESLHPPQKHPSLATARGAGRNQGDFQPDTTWRCVSNNNDRFLKQKTVLEQRSNSTFRTLQLRNCHVCTKTPLGQNGKLIYVWVYIIDRYIYIKINIFGSRGTSVLQHQYLITENKSFYREQNKHALMIDVLGHLKDFMHFCYPNQ